MKEEKNNNMNDDRFIRDGMNGFERNVKRFVDCILALTALIIFSPLFLVCYIAVKQEDHGPAIPRTGHLQAGAHRTFRTPILHLQVQKHEAGCGKVRTGII